MKSDSVVTLGSVTTVKPDKMIHQVSDMSSGLHPTHNEPLKYWMGMDPAKDKGGTTVGVIRILAGETDAKRYSFFGQLAIGDGTGKSTFYDQQIVGRGVRNTSGFKMKYVTPKLMIPQARLPKSPYTTYNSTGAHIASHGSNRIGKYMQFKVGKWTDEELDLIATHGRTHTAKQLMQNFMPDRWYEDISRKRRELGIKINKDVRYKRLWNGADMDILNKCRGMSPTTLTEVFPKRTRHAIRNKMKSMGLI